MRALPIAALALVAMTVSPAHAAEGNNEQVAMPDWLPATAERAQARAEIEALMIEYSYRLDHGQAERLWELFTPDAVLRTPGGMENTGREAIKEFYARRSKTRVTRHVSSNMRVRFIDADHAETTRVITYYRGEPDGTDRRFPAVESVSEYVELVERGEDGQWRYTSRMGTPLFAPAQPRP